MQTYLFYDIESTGLNKCFDQVLQFAAIRTTLDFKEIERTELLIKLNPDVFPSPYASITHRISLAESSKGISEYEAIKIIHRLLNTPGTISLGYNTLGFDDEFLRFSFYRNLLPPYTHQFAKQCYRMDLYPIALFYRLYGKAEIHWPERSGKPSMKLEDISTANNLATGQAHQAITDVEATLALAKVLAADNTMWGYLSDYFIKPNDQQRLLKLTPAFTQLDARFTQALCIQGKFGAKNHYQAPVLHMGQHQHYKNQSLWLRLDHIDLSQLTLAEACQQCYCIRKRLGEPPFMLPMSERFLSHLSKSRLDLSAGNTHYLAQNPNFLEQLSHFFQHEQYPEISNVDVDALLYQRGFPTRQDEQECYTFHQAPIESKYAAAHNITDALYQEQAIRILGRHFPEQLPGADSNTYSEYLAQLQIDNATVDYKNEAHRTIKHCLLELKMVQKERQLDEAQLTLLDELKAYYLRATTS